MTLETIFHVLGITFMSLSILILLAIGIFVFYIWKVVVDIQKQIEARLTDIKHLTDDPGETALKVGAKVADAAIRKVKEFGKK